MRAKTGRTRTLLSLLSLMSLVVSLSLAATSSSLAGGKDPRLAEGDVAGERAREPGRGIAGLQPAADHGLHVGHLGYEKQAGRSIGDPTSQVQVVLSTEEQSELQAYYARKQEGVDPARITFRSGITIRPKPGIEPAVLEEMTGREDPASGESYYVIQFSYPFPTEARYRLEETGVTFHDYVDVAGLYAQVPAQAVEVLQSLMAEGLVRYVGGIPPEAKLAPDLAVEAGRHPEAEAEVIVLTFDEPTPAQLEELGRLLVIERRSDGAMHILEGRVSASSLEALAGLGYVRWVERQPINAPGNLDGGMGIGADVVWATGVDGSGVQVMVVDTGIARSDSTYHPDLQSGRVLDQYDYQNDDSSAAEDYSDSYGHGTHVAGTIGGRYNSGDSNSRRSWQGVAPGADFLIYKLCCGANQYDSTWFVDSLVRATTDPFTTTISNNSWGLVGGNGVYNTSSEIADRAVRGVYNDKYLNVVTASLNDNLLTTAPGTGKNVITVGAVKDGNYPKILFDDCDGIPEYNWPPVERVCYSNYGPIDTDGDGETRIKPDLMAPGAMISSAAPWYLYDDNRYYQFNHGTSMAASFVSGAIAQILDAYSETHDWLVDWPEIIKALLLATAVDVGGNTDYYGRGLIDPYHAIYWQDGVNEPIDFWADSLSDTVPAKSFTFPVPDGYEEVRVVLTWADLAASTEVNNDLDIVWVKDGGGKSCGFSVSYDDTVEYVRVGPGCEPGNWTIRVEGFSLSSLQNFGLVAHTILAGADLSVAGSVEYDPGSAVSVDPGGYFSFHQNVSNSGYTAGGSYAELKVPDGFWVQGVWVYTDDGHSHWYDANQLYYDPSAPERWQVAVGETLAGHPRHVEWWIQADEGVACGPHTFESTAHWREEGEPHSTVAQPTDVTVTCKIYLPLLFRNH